MTDPLDLEAIEARVNAATGGTWEWNRGVTDHGSRYEYLEANFGDGERLTVIDGDGGCILREEDQDFIAHSRTDVPALIARVRTLETALDRACAGLAEATRDLAARRAHSAAMAAATDEMLAREVLKGTDNGQN